MIVDIPQFAPSLWVSQDEHQVVDDTTGRVKS